MFRLVHVVLYVILGWYCKHLEWKFITIYWVKTCFGPIRSLFTYYHNKFSSQNNVQDDMKRFTNKLNNFSRLDFFFRFKNLAIFLVKTVINFDFPLICSRCSFVFEDKCKTISVPKCTIDWEKRCTSTQDCTTIDAKSCTEVRIFNISQYFTIF